MIEHCALAANGTQPAGSAPEELVDGIKRYDEVLRDGAHALAPIGKPHALDMRRSRKGYKLLAGLRGAKPVALDALAKAIARVSELPSDRCERLAGLDVNPIPASVDRVFALAVIAGP